MINSQPSKSQKKIHIILTALIAFGILFSIVIKKFNFTLCLSPYPCLSNTYLHIYCPGCGGTRALTSLLRLSFVESCMCNPIVIYIFIIFLYYYIKNTLYILSNGKFSPFVFKTSIVYIALIILFTNFILRNVLAIFFNIDYLGDIHSFWN